MTTQLAEAVTAAGLLAEALLIMERNILSLRHPNCPYCALQLAWLAFGGAAGEGSGHNATKGSPGDLEEYESACVRIHMTQRRHPTLRYSASRENGLRLLREANPAEGGAP